MSQPSSVPGPSDVTVTQVLPLVRTLPDDATVEEQAEATGLRYVDEEEPGRSRVRRGRGFSYHEPDGTLIDGEERARIQALAIPPAWTDVWICCDADGHVQATGRDGAGRKQYRYHDVWRQLREAAKFDRLTEVADGLPRIRHTVDRHLRHRTLDRERVLALVVALLDRTLLRVGNRAYAETTGSRGLTTLEAEHVELSTTSVRFAFPGKSGKQQDVTLRDPRLARQLLRIQDTPGQHLFAYRHDGVWHEVDSSAVNHYLAEIAGTEITAKDFRTWGGTVLAAGHLRTAAVPVDERSAEQAILAAVDAAADRLGNTRAVARASYVHPMIPKSYRHGRFAEHWQAEDDGNASLLSADERAVRRLLELDLPPSADLLTQLGGTLAPAGRPRPAEQD